jgi:hypothetical protein
MDLTGRVDALSSKCREDWRVEKEPHDDNDGTTHLNHVRYTVRDMETRS